MGVNYSRAGHPSETPFHNFTCEPTMAPKILGLHHVTATVTDAQADLDFYTRVLGMRLVKKTVNFDNHHVYHFYYGNTRGEPGTIMTTFPYGTMGVRPARPVVPFPPAPSSASTGPRQS